MKRNIQMVIVLSFGLLMLAACSSPNESLEANNDEVVDTDESEAREALDSTVGDPEINITGEITVDAADKMIVFEAETNLLEGMEVKAILDKAYGEISLDVVTLTWETTQVDSDGNIYLEYPLEDEIFEKYHGEDFEFLVEMGVHQTSGDLVDAYGAYGVDFSGPFAYRFDSFGDAGKKLIIPTYFRMGDEETTYPIEPPVWGEKPADYGEPEIWIDAEIADNDHRFLYVEGKTNILEGAMIRGEYYPSEDTIFADGFISKAYIQPDGTFELPIKYESITHDGYVDLKVRTMYTHRNPTELADAYGENFELLTGEFIEDDNGKRQEIALTIDTEGMDIATPGDSLITEDDGELRIEVPEDVLFDFDESRLKDEAKDTLDEAVAVLERLAEDEVVHINGHTDNKGDADYNLNLSEKRAEAVAAYLSDSGDIDHLALEIKGYGLKDPIASNATEEGRQKNRRVEIVFQEND